MLDVFYTVDVEVWCGGWKDIDDKFPDAFRRYIHGSTARGDYGLPYQLRLLQAHGLTGVFFIEPMFALRFGQAALDEIVGLVRDAGQEVQLHLHTEWVDEAREAVLPGPQRKRQHLRYFSREEQTVLIAKGLELMRRAGVTDINAFRAGSFAFNHDTLPALAANGITFDSSYNASMFGPDSGVSPGSPLVEPVAIDGVVEYPMTVYRDGTSELRHAQLTACSWPELEGLLWQAVDEERKAFVLLSHGFELLNRAKDRPDDVVVRRFERLCAFLDRHRDVFRSRGFRDLEPALAAVQPAPLVSPLHRTGGRMLSQFYRRRYG